MVSNVFNFCLTVYEWKVGAGMNTSLCAWKSFVAHLLYCHKKIKNTPHVLE